MPDVLKRRVARDREVHLAGRRLSQQAFPDGGGHNDAITVGRMKICLRGALVMRMIRASEI